MSAVPQHQFTWSQPIPTQVVLSQLGKSAAALMDMAAQGHSEAIRALRVADIKWSIGCIRGPDPAHTTEPEEVLRLLVASSRFFLVAKSKDTKVRFSRSEELFTPPQLALEYLQQHSQLICSRRQDVADDMELDQEEPVPLLYERISHQGGNHRAATATDLAAALDQWVQEHPQADRRLVAVTRTAITYLVQTGGE